MNEPVPTPLRVDARTILESFNAMLVFLMPAIAALSIENEIKVFSLLIVGGINVAVARLLGKNNTDSIEVLTATINRYAAANTVLSKEAPFEVKKQANEAASSIVTPSTVKETPVGGPG